MSHENNPDKAAESIQRALAINPQLFLAWNDLGRIQVIKGENGAAEASFRMAISEVPYLSAPYNNLADVLAKTGRYGEAASCLQSSLAADPSQPGLRTELGILYIQAGMSDQAIAQLQQALTTDPHDSRAEFNLAEVCQQTGKLAEAAAHYRRTLDLDPSNTIAANNLAWWLAASPDPAQRNGDEAVRFAELACSRTQYKMSFLIGTLAAAYAEAGRYGDAINTAQRACDQAAANGETNLLQRNQQLLGRYRQHLPAHD